MKIISYTQNLIIFFICSIINQTSFAYNIEIVKNIENYLNSIHSLKADFKQEDNLGNYSEGTLTILKPYNFKLETNPPQHNVIIGNKSLIIHHDYKLNQTSHTSAESSILNLLLKNDLKLNEKNINIKKLEVSHHNIELEIESLVKRNLSSLILIFDKNPLQLRQISVQQDGELVSMVLYNTEINVNLSEKEFIFEKTKSEKLRRR